MSKNKFVVHKQSGNSLEFTLIEIKSKVKVHILIIYDRLLMVFLFDSQFDAEFRRWSIKKNPENPHTFDDFYLTIERFHKLSGVPFIISYIDPRDNDLLPINNGDNYHRALTTARPLLRIIIQKKGDSFEETMGYGTMRPKNLISSLLGQTPVKSKALAISNPHDFRQVEKLFFIVALHHLT